MEYNIYYQKAMLFDKILIEINELLEDRYSKTTIAEWVWMDVSALNRLISWNTDARLKTLHKVYNLIKNRWIEIISVGTI